MSAAERQAELTAPGTVNRAQRGQSLLRGVDAKARVGARATNRRRAT